MFNLKFDKIHDDNGDLRFYPKQEGLEFLLVLNSGEVVHCISVETLEDTCYGSEYMITIVPFNEDNHTHIEYSDCTHIHYFG